MKDNLTPWIFENPALRGRPIPAVSVEIDGEWHPLERANLASLERRVMAQARAESLEPLPKGYYSSNFENIIRRMWDEIEEAFLPKPSPPLKLGGEELHAVLMHKKGKKP